MLTLKQIIRAHNQFRSSHSLPNLGDGYPIKCNPIYHNIRGSVIKYGYQFSQNHYAEFNSLRLAYLPEMHKRKEIAYCDNVSALKTISTQGLGNMKWNELPQIANNYLLHEACHGIARQINLKHIGFSFEKNSSLKKNRNFILASLMEEAFANTCELLSYGYATSILHEFFLDQNNYKPTNLKIAQIKRFLKKYDFKVVFGILFLSYLHANFLYKELSSSRLEKSLLIIQKHFDIKTEYSNKQLKELKILFDAGLDLDIGFRVFTNMFFFKLVGVKTEIFDLLNFDFLITFNENSSYLKCIEQMCLTIQ